MKITILTYGSRGDVQPFIPLSLGLMARGHSVKLAAPARFKSLIEEQDISFVPLAGDPAELSRRLNDSGSNFIKMVRGLMDHAIEIGADVLLQTEEACSDADFIIHTFMHAVGAHTLAREKNIPDLHIQLFPMFTPTGDYPNVTLPDLRLRSLNRLSHKLSRLITVWTSRMGFEQVCRRLGFPKRKLYSPFDKDTVRPRTPILCSWSPSVIPISSDWPSNVHVTGYFFDKIDSAYQPDVELQNFLATGDLPICVSFGSMLNQNAKNIDYIVQESIRQTNNRGIILSGWSGLKNRSSNEILYVDAIPHQWLLPRCKMIIHHGGAGTTSAGLRAGIPNIVIPFMADQHFWGKRVKALGTGTAPIPVKKLSVENLIQSIVESEKDAIRKRTQILAQQLTSDNGVENTVRIIEKHSDDFLRKKL